MPVSRLSKGGFGASTLGRLERFALAWKAKALLLFGLQARADEVFEHIVSRSPHDVYALNSLGYAALQRQDHPLAHSYFERVRDLGPQVSNAHFNLAFVAELLGNLADAEQGFRAALEIEEKMDRAVVRTGHRFGASRPFARGPGGA